MLNTCVLTTRGQFRVACSACKCHYEWPTSVRVNLHPSLYQSFFWVTHFEGSTYYFCMFQFLNWDLQPQISEEASTLAFSGPSTPKIGGRFWILPSSNGTSMGVSLPKGARASTGVGVGKQG